MFLLFSLLMLPVFSFGAQAENEPVESLLSAVIQESYPDCKLSDYAPIGQPIFSFIGLPRLFVMEKMGSVSGKKLHIRRIDLVKLNVVHLTS
jgi:hypothetical protein